MLVFCTSEKNHARIMNGTTHLRMDQKKNCLSRPYHFRFFKGCLPQILLGPSLDTLSQMMDGELFKINLRVESGKLSVLEIKSIGKEWNSKEKYQRKHCKKVFPYNLSSE